jgi:choloylglycine hydrolase
MHESLQPRGFVACSRLDCLDVGGNIADTLWLTMADQKNKIYFYQSTNSPSTIWAMLGDLDFGEGSGPRKLQLDGNPDLAGDQTQNLKPAELFKFLSPDVPH